MYQSWSTRFHLWGLFLKSFSLHLCGILYATSVSKWGGYLSIPPCFRPLTHTPAPLLHLELLSCLLGRPFSWESTPSLCQFFIVFPQTSVLGSFQQHITCSSIHSANIPYILSVQNPLLGMEKIQITQNICCPFEVSAHHPWLPRTLIICSALLDLVLFSMSSSTFT